MKCSNMFTASKVLATAQGILSEDHERERQPWTGATSMADGPAVQRLVLQPEMYAMVRRELFRASCMQRTLDPASTVALIVVSSDGNG